MGVAPWSFDGLALSSVELTSCDCVWPRTPGINVVSHTKTAEVRNRILHLRMEANLGRLRATSMVHSILASYLELAA
jgi:hypothetical protein